MASFVSAQDFIGNGLQTDNLLLPPANLAQDTGEDSSQQIEFGGVEASYDHELWPVYEALKTIRVNLAHPEAPSAFLVLKSRLQKLSTVRCATCGGYGHQERDCLTYRTLKPFLAPGTSLSTIWKAARSCANPTRGYTGILGKRKNLEGE